MFSIIISNNFGSQMAERGQGYQGGRGRGRGRRGRGNHNGPRHVYQTNTPEESRPRSQSRPFSNQRDQETVGQRGQQTRFVQVFPVRSPTNTQESNGQPNYAPAQKSTSHLDSPCSPSQSDPAVAPFPASAVSVSEFSFGEHNHSSFTQHQAAGESRVTARPQTDLHARIEQLESQLRDLAFLPCLIEELTKFATKQGDDIAALRTELGVVGKGFERNTSDEAKAMQSALLAEQQLNTALKSNVDLMDKKLLQLENLRQESEQLQRKIKS